MMWKDIPGWEGIYQISEDGTVKGLLRTVSYIRDGITITQSVPETIIKQYGKRYRQVNLWNASQLHHKYVHILVAQSFIPNPNNLPEVNHLDGVKTNNHYKNLEWSTRCNNIQHSYDIGIRKSTFVGKNGANNYRSKRIIQKDLNGNYINEFSSITDAEKVTGVSKKTIIDSCKNKPKVDRLFKWSYK